MPKPAEVTACTGQAAATRLVPLEAIRGFAAAYVFMCHVCNVYLHNPGWALPFRFGAEAVVLFFLLSGFVVRFSTGNDTTVKAFFVRRIKRIYPLFLCSLIFSYLMGCWSAGEWMPAYWGNLLGNLLMLQDFGAGRPGAWFDQYFNEALWSLAYEWWFYVIFICLLRGLKTDAARDKAVLAIGAGAMLIHSVMPNQLGYYAVNVVIWWSAACAARQFRRNRRVSMRRMLGWAAVLMLFGASWLPFYADTPASMRSLGLYPLLDMRRFLAGAVFLCVGTLWHRLWHPYGEVLFDWTFGPFKRLASMSYGIYIFHFPIITLFANSALRDNTALCLAAMTGSTLLVAYAAEHHLQRWINRWPMWLERAPRGLATA